MIPTPCIFDILRQHSEYSVIFVFRDPRAYLASLAHHLKRKRELYPRVRSNTIPELIEDLMHEGRCQLNTYGHFYPSVRGVVNVFNTYLGWLKAPNVLAIRYEELVGEPGGGNSKLQQETIKKIAQHLEVDFTQAQVEKAVNSLLENRFREFRKGTIDSWKDDFSQDLLDKFYDLDSPRLFSLCWS